MCLARIPFCGQVSVRWKAGEVLAVYKMEELSMELTIKLPTNHSLGQPQVEAGQRVGVSKDQWRKWMLQLTAFLAFQVSRYFLKLCNLSVSVVTVGYFFV